MGTKKNLIIDSNNRIMKKLFLFMAISLVSLHEVYSQDYQVADSIVEDTVLVDTIAQDSVYFTPKDSLFLSYISDVADYIVESIEYVQPRYKMYRTENLYNLIELDTATGRLWQVQFGMNGSSSRMKVAIDDESLLYDWEKVVPGRFELYPTSNMYTFILLDTYRGRTYQVQWNTNPDKRFRISIY